MQTEHLEVTGNDVTSFVGLFPETYEWDIFRHYKACFDLAVKEPTVPHFRQCADAYDDVMDALNGARQP